MSDRSCPLHHRKPPSPSAVKDKNVCQFVRFASLLATTPVKKKFDILVLCFLCGIHTLKMVQLASYEYPCCINSTKCLGPVGRIVYAEFMKV